MDTKTEKGVGCWETLRGRLFEPVDIASLAVFRIMFGAIVFWDVWHYVKHDWIRAFYIHPTFYFKYYGFEWVHPWPGEGMFIHFFFVAVCAVCLMTGLFYRITSWLLFFGLAFWFLLDQARYLNHEYMVLLLAFIMALIPAHRAKSLDTRLRPKLSSNTIPAWCLWLLRLQVGIVYFYGGIAKLNADWLRGEPIRQWMARRSDYPLVGQWIDTELTVWIICYGGLIFDLAIVPLLLWRKTRPWAFAVSVVFHVANGGLFDIGPFPIFMVAGSLLMFPADWPRKVFLFFAPLREDSNESAEASSIPARRRGVTEVILVTYVAIQLLVPFRHFLYPGNVHWTEEGIQFSWHMMLRQKTSATRFYVEDLSSGEKWQLDQRKYLTGRQLKMLDGKPDLCIQFVHFLAEELKKEGHEEVEIRVRCISSLNSRRPQDLYDGAFVLSREPRTLGHAEWILPLVDQSPVLAE